MGKKLITVVIFTLIGSVLPDIIINKIIGYTPEWLNLLKFIILSGAALACVLIQGLEKLSKYFIVLAAAVLIQMIDNIIITSEFWKSAFNMNSFVGNIGSNILLKAIGIIPIIVLLFVMLKSRKEFYLCRGDLSVKSNKISFLGIRENTISWGKLSLISAILISTGTILLTIFTAVNISVSGGMDKLLKYLPIIVVFAAANSFCEGVLFRSAVMGTLKTVLPKSYVVLIAAVFFGIPHYYGVPSGVGGAVMSCILGWYMCRSMYETKGFVSSWIIHLFQDAVIFSTLCLFGNLV